MKKATIEIQAKFGSKFQEQFAQDFLCSTLKAYLSFLIHSHKGNDMTIKINGDNIEDLDWFNWEQLNQPK